MTTDRGATVNNRAHNLDPVLAARVTYTLARALQVWRGDTTFAQFLRQRLLSDALYQACIDACSACMMQDDVVAYIEFESIPTTPDGERMVRTLVLTAIQEINRVQAGGADLPRI